MRSLSVIEGEVSDGAPVSCVSDGQLYAGTVADFAGSDPLIYRDPLRTEQFELKQLNGKDDYFGADDFIDGRDKVVDTRDQGTRRVDSTI